MRGREGGRERGRVGGRGGRSDCDSLPSGICVCSEVSRTAEIAEALQNRLDAYKAEKRELGSVSSQCGSESHSSFT